MPQHLGMGCCVSWYVLETERTLFCQSRASVRLWLSVIEANRCMTCSVSFAITALYISCGGKARDVNTQCLSSVGKSSGL